MPVLGSGHPQADVLLLMFAPTPAEVEEGVAFDGRAGTALMKSLRDADIIGEPSSLYYAQVQALKFLQTRATPAGARRASRRRQVKRALAGRDGS
jgi:uracil-DNA glycosylase